MGPNWLLKKEDKDMKNDQLRMMLGDETDLKQDLDYLLRNRDASPESLAELRQKRLREEAEIERQAAIERAKLEEKRQIARVKAIENWTIQNLGEHIVITIQDKRLKKMRSFDDIACVKCHKPLYRGRGMAIEAAEYLKTSPLGGTVRPSVNIESVVCASCNEANRVMVQSVW
jgi:hypothetical protein